MARMPQEPRSRMNEFLPDYDFHAAYETCVNAPASAVYRRLLVSDFYSARVVRLLMALRTGKRISCHRPPRDLRGRFEGSGFLLLAEAPGEELVIGVAGKFWRPDGGRCLDITAADFVGFSRPGSAKAVMNFRLKPGSPHGTVLSTETRIKCCDRAA